MTITKKRDMTTKKTSTSDLLEFADFDPTIIKLVADAARELVPANEQYVVDAIDVLEKEALERDAVAVATLGLIVDKLFEMKEEKGVSDEQH